MKSNIQLEVLKKVVFSNLKLIHKSSGWTSKVQCVNMLTEKGIIDAGKVWCLSHLVYFCLLRSYRPVAKENCSDNIFSRYIFHEIGFWRIYFRLICCRFDILTFSKLKLLSIGGFAHFFKFPCLKISFAFFFITGSSTIY